MVSKNVAIAIGVITVGTLFLLYQFTKQSSKSKEEERTTLEYNDNNVVSRQINMTSDEINDDIKDDNDLNTRLANRPSPDEVGIDTDIAPRIQGARNDLEYNMTKDKVSKGLKQRGTAQEAGVDTSIAPAIQGAKNDLEYNMTKDKVSKGLKQRKSQSDAVSKGIIKHNNVAPALRRQSSELENALKTDKLNKGLRNRASMEQLQSTGIIKQGNSNLQASREALIKAKKIDTLNKKLIHRSSVDQLKERMIIKDDAVIQEQQQRRSSAKIALNEKLNKIKQDKK